MSLLDNNGLSYLWGKIKGYVGGQLPSDFTGATTASAGTHGLVPAPTAADTEKFLQANGSWGDGGKPMVILSYGNSTWADFIDAYNHNVIVYCRASSNSNPATGSQTRLGFMAYVNNAENPTEVEFQYYRSVSSHSATQQGDQVYVYKLTKTGGWTVTTRESYTKIIGGTNTTTTYNNGALTINATDTDTWRNININGVEKLGTAKTTGSVGFINGLNTTVTYDDTNRTIQIDADGGGSDTDTNVTQTESTDNDAYEVLVSGTASTATTTEGANKSLGFRYNPSIYAVMEGYATTAADFNAHAEGTETYAGENCHAEGYGCFAEGGSHAEGSSTTAVDYNSHAEGSDTYASSGSHVEGYYSCATGQYSHAEGEESLSEGSHSHTEGYRGWGLGNYSHAEGSDSQARGDISHAEGSESVTYGDCSHAENNSMTEGDYSHSEGYKTTASGDYSHSEGYYTWATTTGKGAHAEGYASSSKPHEASGIGSHVEGYGTSVACNKANGDGSHAEGFGTYAQGNYSHAEGRNTTASGRDAHAEGSMNRADGNASHVEGNDNYAKGSSSHAEGADTTAFGISSHSEGYATYAGGTNSHVEGDTTTANGENSHVEGNYTVATHRSQHVFGEYNLVDASTAYKNVRGTYVEIVGNGLSSTQRSNARTLDWNGNEVLAGNITLGSGKDILLPSGDTWDGTNTSIKTAFSEIKSNLTDLATIDFGESSSVVSVNGTYQIPAEVLAHTFIIIGARRQGWGNSVMFLTANLLATDNGFFLPTQSNQGYSLKCSSTGLLTLTAKTSGVNEPFIFVQGIF